MKHLEQARLFLAKALEDEALLDAVMENPGVSDAIYGFHCQQGAEKLLKALLSAHRAIFKRSHDVGELLTLLAKAGHPLPQALQQVDTLTPFAVEFLLDYWSDHDKTLPWNWLCKNGLLNRCHGSLLQAQK